jgi:hypothetical protein
MNSHKIEIAETLIRYCTGIDLKDRDLFASAWLDGGDGLLLRISADRTRFVVEPVAPEHRTHPDHIRDTFHEAHAGLITAHRVVNIEVEIVSDGVARAQSYSDAVLAAPSTRETCHVMGRYEDTLRLAQGRWRIEKRTHTDVWTTGNPHILSIRPSWIDPALS